jgi:hypothetical protein
LGRIEYADFAGPNNRLKWLAKYVDFAEWTCRVGLGVALNKRRIRAFLEDTSNE